VKRQTVDPIHREQAVKGFQKRSANLNFGNHFIRLLADLTFHVLLASAKLMF
jgi:hypothetical protein